MDNQSISDKVNGSKGKQPRASIKVPNRMLSEKKVVFFLIQSLSGLRISHLLMKA